MWIEGGANSLKAMSDLNLNLNPNPASRLFDHEKLQVYQESLCFISWLAPLMDTIPKSVAVRDQLDRASTSILLNLAEGNGKFTASDRCHFFDNSRGSALECAAALDVLVSQGRVPASDVTPGKTRLRGIVPMLVGLIKANSNYRIHESPVEGGD
jgi:four helix bundle protein